MANKKFSEFELKTTTSNVSHIVGYNGAENVRITPANFISGSGGPFLPLAGGIMVGNTTHNDNVKSIYGTSGDGLQIYHDGSNSYIVDSGTGGLNLLANSDFAVKSYGTDEPFISAATNAFVKLFFDGSEKLATTSTGISVTGNGVFTGDVNITQSTDVGVLNTTNLESGAAVGLSLTYPTSNVDAGDGLAIAIGITGRGRSYIANSNLTNNLDASNLEFYTESGGVINKILTLSESKDATFAGNVDLGSFSTATVKTFSLKTSNSIFNISTDGTSGALGTTIGYSWANGGQGPLKFNNASGEVMRLDASGNLGLGVSSTNYRLKVQSPTGDSKLLHLKNPSNSFGQSSVMRLGTETTDSYGADIGFFRGTSSDADRGLFLDGSGTGVHQVKLLVNGNLGIGTDSPAYKTSIKQEGDFNGSQVLLDLSLRDTVGGSYNAGTGGGISFSSSHWSQSTTEKIMGSIFGANSNGGTGVNGYLSFRTRLSDTVAEKMRIASAGEIQFGTGTNNGGFLDFDGTSLQLNTQRNPNTGAFVDTAKSNASINLVGADGGSYIRFSTANANNTTASERMRITSDGDLLIANTSFTGRAKQFEVNPNTVDLKSSSSSTGLEYHQEFSNPNGTVGSITTSASATAYNTSSDYRLKEDLQDFEGLDLVSKIPVYDYKWKADKSRSYGVLAHQLQEVLPQAVSGDKDAKEMQSVDYSKIVPLLVKSIQELKAEIELLKNK